MQAERPVIFHSRARDEVRDLPKDLRYRLGRALMALQLGYPLGMPVSRPMSMIAVGVDELRLREPDGNYRVFYYRKYPKGILVLRAFRKKTERTPQSEILLARRRLKEMLDGGS
jgi:phage-related protein